MSDVPIIFSAPMVRAFLDDRKTMTRRLAWRDAEFGLQDYASEQLEEMDSKGWSVVGEGNDGLWRVYKPTSWQRVTPGDRLWIRENHRLTDCECTEACRGAGHVWYDSDESGYRNVANNRLRPSIHMPRWASRLTLIVTATKIERLQEISEADAIAEGVYSGRDGDLGPLDISARALFADLWRKLHGPESVEANPEVVALTFTVHKQNIDTLPKAEAA